MGIGILLEGFAAAKHPRGFHGRWVKGDKVHVVTPQGHVERGVVQEPPKMTDVITSRGSERYALMSVKWADGDVSGERPQDVKPGHPPAGAGAKPAARVDITDRLVARRTKIAEADVIGAPLLEGFAPAAVGPPKSWGGRFDLRDNVTVKVKGGDVIGRVLRASGARPDTHVIIDPGGGAAHVEAEVSKVKLHTPESYAVAAQREAAQAQAQAGQQGGGGRGASGSSAGGGGGGAVREASICTLLEGFDPGKHPRDFRGRWRDFFHAPAGHEVLKVADLTPAALSKASSVAEAGRRMDLAAGGKGAKRAPLTGVRDAAGRVTITDGKATLARLKELGVTHAPVMVTAAPTAADAHGGFKVGDVVTHETGSRGAGGHGPVTFTKQPGVSEVVGLQRNGNLRLREPAHGTTHDVHHSHAQHAPPVAGDTYQVLGRGDAGGKYDVVEVGPAQAKIRSQRMVRGQAQTTVVHHSDLRTQFKRVEQPRISGINPKSTPDEVHAQYARDRAVLAAEKLARARRAAPTPKVKPFVGGFPVRESALDSLLEAFAAAPPPVTPAQSQAQGAKQVAAAQKSLAAGWNASKHPRARGGRFGYTTGGQRVKSTRGKRATRSSSAAGRVLTTGANGALVSSIQRQLRVSADGKYGPQTQAAVTAYQRQHGLTVDGKVGRQTLAALRGNPNAKSITPGPIAAKSARVARHSSQRVKRQSKTQKAAAGKRARFGGGTIV